MKKLLLAGVGAMFISGPAMADSAGLGAGLGGAFGSTTTTFNGAFEGSRFVGAGAGVQGGTFVDGATVGGGIAAARTGTIGAAGAIRFGNDAAVAGFGSVSGGEATTIGANTRSSFEAGTTGSAFAENSRVRSFSGSVSSTTTGVGLTAGGVGFGSIGGSRQ